MSPTNPDHRRANRPPEPAASRPGGLREGASAEGIRTLNPGYFALVMATGIVSIAMANHHAYPISVTLLWITGLTYAVLVLGYGWRLVAYPSAVRADLADPARAFGFFTFVAATDVFGTRLTADGHRLPALILLAVGSVSWLVLGYLVPWTAVLGHTRRPVLQHANGTWFIWVVGSQSVAVLAAALQPAVHTGQRELALLAVFTWSLGAFGYAAATIFVAARALLYDLRPADLTPPYWVSMGATAITVVAGARIVQMTDAPIGVATRGLIAGASVVFWMFGTWLIPALIAAGLWRHVVHRIPLRYEPALWSVVFPLGMYGVGSHYLGQADHLPILESIGAHESWVALAAWILTFLAMLAHLATLARRPKLIQDASSGETNGQRA